MEYPKYKKVVFCTDFSENADYAFEFAYDFAKRDEGLLCILYVIPDNPHRAYAEGVIPSEILEKVDKEFEADLANNYREHYVEKIENGVPYEIITKSGKEHDEILRFAEQQEADLIVMGTHGRTGVEHVLFGSIAKKVLRKSPVPVFVVPSKRRAEFPSTIYVYRGEEQRFVEIPPKEG